MKFTPYSLFLLVTAISFGSLLAKNNPIDTTPGKQIPIYVAFQGGKLVPTPSSVSVEPGDELVITVENPHASYDGWLYYYAGDLTLREESFGNNSTLNNPTLNTTIIQGSNSTPHDLDPMVIVTPGSNPTPHGLDPIVITNPGSTPIPNGLDPIVVETPGLAPIAYTFNTGLHGQRKVTASLKTLSAQSVQEDNENGYPLHQLHVMVSKQSQWSIYPQWDNSLELETYIQINYQQ